MTTETTTQEPETAEIAFINPLVLRKIRPPCNWHEWLKRFNNPEATHLELLGLLHDGFKVSMGKVTHDEPEYGWNARIIYYFLLANGWDNRSDLVGWTDDPEWEYQFGQDKNGNRLKYSESQMRQILAKKAFDVLVQNFFKSEHRVRPEDDYKGSFNDTWKRDIFNSNLFPIIMRFFEPQRTRFSDKRVEIRNLSSRLGDASSRSANETIVIEFLFTLSIFLWQWTGESINSWTKNADEVRTKNEADLLRVEEARVWMIEIFAFLGKLHHLEKWMLKLSDVCVAKLREIALRSSFKYERYPLNADRCAATLEEAVLLNSPAALFLKRFEIKKRETERLTAMREAEKDIQMRQRQLEELQGQL